jgi:hypothetical protein
MIGKYIFDFVGVTAKTYKKVEKHLPLRDASDAATTGEGRPRSHRVWLHTKFSGGKLKIFFVFLDSLRHKKA